MLGQKFLTEYRNLIWNQNEFTTGKPNKSCEIVFLGHSYNFAES